MVLHVHHITASMHGECFATQIRMLQEAMQDQYYGWLTLLICGTGYVWQSPLLRQS